MTRSTSTAEQERHTDPALRPTRGAGGHSTDDGGAACSADVPPEAVGLRERKKRHTRASIHDTALNLAMARGLDHMTVEEISAGADISVRTFFNYFPSKAAAVLGVTVDPLCDEERAAFLTGGGNVVDELCGLLACHLTIPQEMEPLRALVAAHPELVDDVGPQVSAIRKDLTSLTAQRTGSRHTADLAVSLVVAAFGVVIHSGSAPVDDLADPLRATVREIGELAR